MLTSSDFLYELGDENIAQEPPKLRGSSKLLVYKKPDIRKSTFEQLHNEIHNDISDTVIVRNVSRVFQARLNFASEHGGRRELFFVSALESTKDKSTWKVLGRPLKKLKDLAHILLPGDAAAKVVSASQENLTIEMPMTQSEVYNYLEEHGSTPLPPYIKREKGPGNLSDGMDKDRYQNTYSKEFGSAAAPTAGLHLTSEYEAVLKEKGVEFIDVELSVGGGTFLPVTAENPLDHKMHTETYFISESAKQAILKAKADNKTILAMGTTSMRATEDFFRHSKTTGTWQSTDLFIYPQTREDRFHSKIFDGIITNFHQPDSTLIMLMAALIGLDEVHRCYEFAQKNGFRFLSYGDSGLYLFD